MTLAFGKPRLCLVGLRLHFPTENRQSRTCFAERYSIGTHPLAPPPLNGAGEVKECELYCLAF